MSEIGPLLPPSETAAHQEQAPTPLPSETTKQQEQRNWINGAKKDAEIVGRRLVETLAATSKTDEQLEADGQGHIIVLKKLVEMRGDAKALGDGEGSFFKDPNTQKPTTIEITKGKPLFVKTDSGTTIRVTRLVGFANKNGLEIGIVQSMDNSANLEIPIDRLIDGQVASEQERISGEFEGAAKTVFEYYASQFSDGENAQRAEEQFFGEGVDLDKTQKTIEEAAQAAGFITSSDIEAFIDSQMPKPEDGKELTPEEQSQIQSLTGIREIAAGKTVIDGQALVKIITSGQDIDPETVAQNLANANKSIEETKKLLEEIDKSLEREGLAEDLRLKLEKQKEEVSLRLTGFQAQKAPLEEIQMLFDLTGGKGIDTITNEYWELLSSGKITTEHATAIREAFRVGNLEKALSGILAEAPKQEKGETDDKFEERKKKIAEVQKLKDRTKNAGIIALLLLFTSIDFINPLKNGR